MFHSALAAVKKKYPYDTGFINGSHEMTSLPKVRLLPMVSAYTLVVAL
jgi:hypothetical protein